MVFDCKDVNLVYDGIKNEQTYALRNINLSLDKNRLVGIMGPSGSGKSSLLYCLSGLIAPTTGIIKYKGMDIHRTPANQRAHLRKTRFGFMFQRNYLIDYLTVLDNILVPVNSHAHAYEYKAFELLESMGISHLVHQKPPQLSGGQRQRVAIARALINDPEVIFADEPTSALDHAMAHSVMDILYKQSAKTLVLVVTHDPSILVDADETIHIWDGSIELKKGEENA